MSFKEEDSQVIWYISTLPTKSMKANRSPKFSLVTHMVFITKLQTTCIAIINGFYSHCIISASNFSLMDEKTETQGRLNDLLKVIHEVCGREVSCVSFQYPNN